MVKKKSKKLIDTLFPNEKFYELEGAKQSVELLTGRLKDTEEQLKATEGLLQAVLSDSPDSCFSPAEVAIRTIVVANFKRLNWLPNGNVRIINRLILDTIVNQRDAPPAKVAIEATNALHAIHAEIQKCSK